jgi:hypothetical protein
MSEKNFWTFIRDNLDLRMYRIENRVSTGMPDVHYIDNGQTGWIELKYIESFPKKGKISIGLRMSQSIWHSRYISHGGKTWILLRVGRTGIFLIDGKNSRALQKMPNISSFLELCSWKHMGNFKLYNWKELKDEILSDGKKNTNHDNNVKRLGR